MKTLSIEGLNKRAKAKFLQDPLIEEMAKLDSPFAQKYDDTIHCSTILTKKGDKLIAKYCGHRWCRICNRNRTGKLLNGYSMVLDQMPEQEFVTLTIPNVTADKLEMAIKGMIKNVKRIQDNRRKQKKPLIRGIRKLECTYNPKRNDYHPHFHFILDSKQTGNELIHEWLQYYPDANILAQDQTEAYSYKDLFKYFTKLTSNTGDEYRNGTKVKDEWAFPEALDIIFRAIEKIRIIQPMGKIKMVSEKIKEYQSEVMDETLHDPKKLYDNFYLWMNDNWIDPFTGEQISSFKPTKNLCAYRKKIRYLPNVSYIGTQ